MELESKPNYVLRSIIVFLSQAIALGAVGSLLLFVAPNFREFFEEFEVDLPVMTVAILNFAKWIAKYWWLGALIWLIYLTASIFFACTAKTRKSFKTRLALTLVPVVAFLIISFIFLLIPYSRLLQNMAALDLF